MRSALRRGVLVLALATMTFAPPASLAEPPAAPSLPPPLVEMRVRPDQRVRSIRHLRKGLFHWKVQAAPDAFWRMYEGQVGLQDAFVRVSYHPNWGTKAADLVPVLRRIRAGGGEPAISMWGLPRALSSSDDEAQTGSDPAWRRWAVAMPRDEAAFRAFVREAIDTWNRAEGLGIRYVEIGNEPDLREFWGGTQAEYLALYRLYAQAIREADPSIRIGGPATNAWTGGIRGDGGRPTHDPEQGVIRGMIRYCAAHEVPLDWISWHFWTPGPGQPHPHPVEATRRWLAEAGLDPATPLVVDEWAGALPSPDRRDPHADSEAEAAYGAAMLVTMANAGIDRQSKTCLFDDVPSSDAHPVPDLEGLAYGAVTTHGVIKPIYNAWRMFAQLGAEQVVLERGEGGGLGPLYALASRDDDCVTILLAHWSQGYQGRRIASARWQSLLDSGFTWERLLEISGEIHGRGLESAWEPFWRAETSVQPLGLVPQDGERFLAARTLLGARVEEARRPLRVRLTVEPLPFEGPVLLAASIVDARHSNAYARRDWVRERLATLRRARADEILSVVEQRGLDVGVARALLDAALAKPSQARVLLGQVTGDLRDVLVAEFRVSRERIWTAVEEEVNQADGVRLHTEQRALPRTQGGALVEVTLEPDSVHLLVLERASAR
jgi:hypothetical protein